MNKTENKSLKINKEIHKKLKIFCIENEINIQHLLEKIILDYIDKK